ncbi:CocE/NonD family hydrolase [Nocardia seriolae]|nr:CocE/NonD family hydrolase [Nocardia seriolae]MTJ70677.1 CocE/NonD family hydrolase [Nocardia seriolae]MTJ86812.1 CocE/NonD family hydrolase [Nocardia seriolae]MTK30806.1 CocE/NonD family hydrolase [Nocardia seriolae]MTK43225.1 CocE/NonD family hydrolase [Nocardia seriolae]
MDRAVSSHEAQRAQSVPDRVQLVRHRHRRRRRNTMVEPLTTALPAEIPARPDARFEIGPVRYPKLFARNTIPITLSDGAILSADILRPGDVGGPTAEPLPAIINFTPYNKMFNRHGMRLHKAARRLAGRVRASDRTRMTARDVVRTPAGGVLEPFAINRTAVARGYVGLMVDVRGTGTSTGAWDFFSPREQLDYVEVLDWVREQPWCNGDIAVMGLSYGAISALHTAAQRPEGLKVVFAIEAGENPPRELGLTGGALTPGMLVWILGVNGAKWIPALPGLLREGLAGKFLRERLTQRSGWTAHALRIALDADHPDGYLNAMWASKLPRLEQIEVPTWIHGGWHDVYNRSNFRMYDRIPVPEGAKQVLVDDSYHLTPGSGFGDSGSPQALDELQTAFFDRWVKGIDNGIDRYGPITLRRQGDGNWLSRDRYPAPDARVHRLYLTGERTGTAIHAGTDAGLSAEPSEVDTRLPLPGGRVSAASGNTAVMTMGISVLFGPEHGNDDRRNEATAVTFTGPPLPADLVLSGPMNLHLRAEAAGTDAFWSVTVCDVHPDGRSVPITRGALLSSLRYTDTDASDYTDGELLFPVHPLTAGSARPVVPGEPFDIDIEISPTEALVRAGHRLRIAVSRTSFPRHLIPPWRSRRITGQTVVLDTEYPSYLSFRARRED